MARLIDKLLDEDGVAGEASEGQLAGPGKEAVIEKLKTRLAALKTAKDSGTLSAGKAPAKTVKSKSGYRKLTLMERLMLAKESEKSKRSDKTDDPVAAISASSLTAADSAGAGPDPLLVPDSSVDGDREKKK